jgi:hypothetical protein
MLRAEPHRPPQTAAASHSSSQAALAVRILKLEPITQHPGNLDRFRMRAHHATTAGRGLAQPEEKAIIDVREAEPCTSPPRLFMNILKVGTP